MAEIIGVAASALQLGQACCSLIDILRKIKGCATVLRQYYDQLQELHNLSTSIYENPLLQTPEIGTQTKALLSTINNNCINSLLSKGKILRAWGFLYREQDLLDIFVTLERQKGTLSLAIHQIQSKALYQIQIDIKRMASNNVIEDTPTKSKYGNLLDHLLYSGALENSSYLHKEIGPISRSRSPAMSQVALVHQADSRPNTATLPARSSVVNDFVTKVNDGLKWNGCIADQGFDQNNGYEWDLDGELPIQFTEKNMLRSDFRDMVKIGDGNQHNGHSIEIGSDFAGIPVMEGDQWTRCIAKRGMVKHDEKTFGIQTNGLKIKVKKGSQL
ncbi:unnamed protein product [Fusarium graminearum]|uniref:Chromosome 3, complete genome n=3 Tax=Gibberella zeae TaxID=5518 RepID=A0A0E0SKZ6_GIBZE|nr:hypothetical protein FG05_12659 [Fusarium graminearum]KAI6757879.1 hypothetical protein HG531_003704 [Fusarium graminearum]PCD39850.1 hypothetical protein FGRA07_01121 [Fusarium graminearum]CAG1967293.1 unnamed protein product [Fusarium graminearum]CAG1969318.1 unnamed protein product [Fusarium graminearum]